MEPLANTSKKLIQFTSATSKTLSTAYHYEKINDKRLSRKVYNCATELFKSFGYALICWYTIDLYNHTFSTELSPSMLWVAFFIRLVFYVRFYIVAVLSLETLENVDNYRTGRNITYHCNASPDDQPLLIEFLHNYHCNPANLSHDDRKKLIQLLSRKNSDHSEKKDWDYRQYYRRKHPIFKRTAFEDFQYYVLNHHIIDSFENDSPITDTTLYSLLETLGRGTTILSYGPIKKEAVDNPFSEIVAKMKTFRQTYGIKKGYQRFLCLKRLFKEYNFVEDPTLRDNLFLYHNLFRFQDLIKHLIDKGIKSPLLTDALAFCQQEMPKLPSGASLCFHFRTEKDRKAWEHGLQVISKEKLWYWHVDSVFWKDAGSAERVGLVSTGYLFDKVLRAKHYSTAKFFKVTLPPGLPDFIRKEADKIFLSRMKFMATTKYKWKRLNLRNTFLIQRNEVDFSYFPLPELYLLASITYVHKTPVRSWNPETFDVTISSKLWCSEFVLFLVIDALQKVNEYLAGRGIEPLPFPVDGYENTAGITPARLKFLLKNAKMLTRQKF
ncbi:MAG: hypothetical protein K940chlam3_00180 [Chlamydiae bacterium]|nr:hypothetical protein [Chlamydiota bacterium]